MYGGEARERTRSNKYIKQIKNEQTKYTEEMYYVYNIVCRTL